MHSTSQFELQTSNAPASLRLPPAYEGSFRLHSTPYKPTIVENEDVKDPYALGRRRLVTYIRERRGLVSGNVAWAEEGAGEGVGAGAMGSVSLKTSNAEAQLYF